MSDYDKKRFKQLNDYSRLFAEQLQPEDFNDINININTITDNNEETNEDTNIVSYDSDDDYINNYEQEIIQQEGYDYCEEIEDYSDYEF